MPRTLSGNELGRIAHSLRRRSSSLRADAADAVRRAHETRAISSRACVESQQQRRQSEDLRAVLTDWR